VASRNLFDLAEGSQEQWADYNPWASFWLRIERKWAEEEKRRLFYPFDGVNNPDDCSEAEEPEEEWADEF